ncbi:mediator of RNA polymerase II transcription subunit 13 [Dispira simplex]|nr:mediator of RNA polymerase II transcription subunit 13 [Dispira simplex]
MSVESLNSYTLTHSVGNPVDNPAESKLLEGTEVGHTDPDVRRELWIFILNDSRVHDIEHLLSELTEVQSGVLNWDGIPGALMGRKMNRTSSAGTECRAFYHAIEDLLERCLVQDYIYRLGHLWVISPHSQLFFANDSPGTGAVPPLTLVGFTLDISPSSLQVLFSPQFHQLNVRPLTSDDIQRQVRVVLSPLGEEATVIRVPALSEQRINQLCHEWQAVFGLQVHGQTPTSSSTWTHPPFVEVCLCVNQRTLYHPVQLVFVKGEEYQSSGVSTPIQVTIPRNDADELSVCTLGQGSIPVVQTRHPIYHPDNPYSHLLQGLLHLDQKAGVGEVGNRTTLGTREDDSLGEAKSALTVSEPEPAWQLNNDLMSMGQDRTRTLLTTISTPGHHASLSPPPVDAKGIGSGAMGIANASNVAGLPTAPSTVEMVTDYQSPPPPPIVHHSPSPPGEGIQAMVTGQSVPSGVAVEPGDRVTNGNGQVTGLMESATTMRMQNYDFEDLDQGLDVTEDDFSFFDAGSVAVAPPIQVPHLESKTVWNPLGEGLTSDSGTGLASPRLVQLHLSTRGTISPARVTDIKSELSEITVHPPVSILSEAEEATNSREHPHEMRPSSESMLPSLQPLHFISGVALDKGASSTVSKGFVHDGLLYWLVPPFPPCVPTDFSAIDTDPVIEDSKYRYQGKFAPLSHRLAKYTCPNMQQYCPGVFNVKPRRDPKTHPDWASRFVMRVNSPPVTTKFDSLVCTARKTWRPQVYLPRAYLELHRRRQRGRPIAKPKPKSYFQKLSFLPSHSVSRSYFLGTPSDTDTYSASNSDSVTSADSYTDEEHDKSNAGEGRDSDWETDLNPELKSTLDALFDSPLGEDITVASSPALAEGVFNPLLNELDNGLAKVSRSGLVSGQSTPGHRKKRRKLGAVSGSQGLEANDMRYKGRAMPAVNGLGVVLLAKTTAGSGGTIGPTEVPPLTSGTTTPRLTTGRGIAMTAAVVGSRRDFARFFPPLPRSSGSSGETSIPASPKRDPADLVTLTSYPKVRSLFEHYQDSLSRDSFLEVVRIICQQAALGSYTGLDATLLGTTSQGWAANSLPSPEPLDTDRQAVCQTTLLLQQWLPSTSCIQGWQSGTPTNLAGVSPPVDQTVGFLARYTQNSAVIVKLQRMLESTWCRLVTGETPGPLSDTTTGPLRGIHFRGPLTLGQLSEISEQNQSTPKYSRLYIKKRRSQDQGVEYLDSPEVVVGYHYPHSPLVLERNELGQMEHTDGLQLQVSPTILTLWEKMQLKPYSATKNITYFALVPTQSLNFEQEYLAGAVEWYLRELGAMYQACRLGVHQPGQLDGLSTGIVPVVDPEPTTGGPTLLGESRFHPYMMACERLGVALRSRFPLDDPHPRTWGSKDILTGTSSHVVVYIVNPSRDPSAVFELCNCIRMLQSMWRNNKRNHPALDSLLTFQILDSFTITKAHSLGTRTNLRALAFSVYTKCYRSLPLASKDVESDKDSKIASLNPTLKSYLAEEVRILWSRCFAPPLALARPLPSTRTVNMTTFSVPFVSPLDSGTTIHVFYGLSVSERWVVTVWVDYRGQLVDVGVYENTGELVGPSSTTASITGEGSSSSTSGMGTRVDSKPMGVVHGAVLRRIWTKTEALEQIFGLPFKYVVARLGSLTEQEWSAWDQILLEKQTATLVVVYPNSSFFAVPTTDPEEDLGTTAFGDLSDNHTSNPSTPLKRLVSQERSNESIPNRLLRRENPNGSSSRSHSSTLSSPKPSPASYPSHTTTPDGKSQGSTPGKERDSPTWSETLVSNSGPTQAYVFNHRQPLPLAHDPSWPFAGTLSPVFSQATGCLLKQLSLTDHRHPSGVSDVRDTLPPVRQYCLEVRLIRPSAVQTAVSTLRDTLRQYHQLTFLNHWVLLHDDASDSTTTVRVPQVDPSGSPGGEGKGILPSSYRTALVHPALWGFLPLPLVMFQRVIRLFAALETPAFVQESMAV